MMSLRTRIFIIVSLALLFILGISIFLLIRSRQPSPADNIPNGTNGNQTAIESGLPSAPPVSVTPIPENVAVVPLSALETEKNGAIQLAKIFLDRYNSFSSESKYQNVRDVQELVTANYWQKLSATILPISPSQPAASFYSVITKSYSAQLSVWETNNAEVSVEAKISEEKNNAINNYNRSALVKLIKTNNQWLVDSFVWQD